MSLSRFRSQIALILGLAMVVGSIPAGYAGSPPSSNPPPGSPATQRRGKNGTVQSPPAGQTASVEAKEARKETQSDPQHPSSASGQRLATEATSDRSTDRPDNGSSPTSTTTEAPQQARRRPQPPPFDRPAAGSKEAPSGGAKSGSDSQSQGGSPRATRQNEKPSSQSGGVDRDSSSERGRTREPELRRPADSRYPQQTSDGNPGDPERGRSQKPVLRKPSDGPETDEEVPAPRSNRSPQPDGAVPDDKDEVLRLDATLVNIPILVSDRSGRYVPQLSARDFVLYEDGAQQEVAFFGSEEVPFNVALVLDMSPSVQGSNDHIHDAAIEFVRQLRRDDKVMVVSFDRRIHFLTDLTNNRRVLESAIRSTTTGSGTSVYDAVYEVIDRLRSVDGRKALILFSDGEDTTSNRASYDEAVDIVTESDVLVYGLRYPGTGSNIRVNPWPRNPIPQIPFPIPWPWPWPRRRGTFTNYSPPPRNIASPAAAGVAQNWPRRGRDFMVDITSAGGGPVYDADRITDLSHLASRMAEELRHVYVISYYPTNSLSNGGFRTIRVRVRGRDQLAVRHRRGYNARDVKKGP